MRLLILGTGGMATTHAKAFAAIPDVELVGGVDTNADRLKAFCDSHGIENRFTTLADALKWGDFHAVANVTPDPAHYPTTMQILAAGKHVFCEKPLATSHALALEMTETAEKSGLVGMVNDLLDHRALERLPIAMAVVAMQQESREVVAFTRGNPGVAIQASCAIGTECPRNISVRRVVRRRSMPWRLTSCSSQISSLLPSPRSTV